MGTLSEGKLPAMASVDSLEAAVSALRNKENEINALVLEAPVLEDPALPLKRRRIARILLQRFARIQSPVKGYAKALGPYQRQASELLPTIDNYTELQDIERRKQDAAFLAEAHFDSFHRAFFLARTDHAGCEHKRAADQVAQKDRGHTASETERTEIRAREDLRD